MKITAAATLHSISLTFALNAPVSADTSLLYSERPDASTELQATHKVVVKNARVGVFRSEEAERPDVVFDKAASTLTFVDHRNRQYTVFSEAGTAAMQKKTREMMKAQQAQMAEQMKDMSPQARAMYQQGQMGMQMMPFMGGMMNAPAQPKSYQPSFATKVVNGFHCRRVDVWQGASKVQEQCAANRESLGIPGEDYASLHAMGQVVERLSALGAFTFGFAAPRVAGGGGQHGMPVEIKDFGDGNPSTVTLEAITADAVDAKMLTIPSNYLEAKIPLLQGD